MRVVYDFLYKIDSSEKTKYVLAVFQLLAGAFSFFYSSYKDTQIETAKWLFYGFIFFQLMVFLFFIMLIIISGKYRLIKLKLNRDTGILYDEPTNFRNVSLRAETLNNILDCIENNDKAYNIGRSTGEKFYVVFNEKLGLKKKMSNEDKLKKWLEYDSSSGIGKFELLDKNFSIRLKVISPFIGICPSSKPNNRCNFLLGYIDGFCSKLYDRNLKSKCEHDTDSCIITIEPIN